MSKSYIPYGRQSIDETDISAVVEVLSSDWLTTGPVVEQFETALAERVSATYCVVFSSGTAALHAAYYATGIRPGDEVITSPITFAATANAALYLGAKPVFVDIGENFFHLDPGKIEAALTSRTKAIVPVDMTGMPADLDPIMDIARKNNLVVIEDACHALGASYKGRPVGSIADMTVFSFHPVKIITTGEGGAVTTNNESFYERLKLCRSHGITKAEGSFTEVCGNNNNRKWYYEQQELGYNYRLSDINCALGLSQMAKLELFLKRRRELAANYNSAFQNHKHLRIPPAPFGKQSTNSSAWHLYILRIAAEHIDRDLLLNKLDEAGIGTQVHYIPVYLHPYYRKLGYQPGMCPNAEDYYSNCFTIPLYPAMSDADQKKVIDAVNQAVNELR